MNATPSRTFLSIALMVFLLTSLSLAQVPKTISYQGILTDTAGTVVPDGNYSLTLKLYDVAAGGTPLWTEGQLVAVSEGIFNVILGSANPLNLPFNRPYYLGLTVESEPELTPRMQLTSAAYSFRAANTDSINGIAAGGDLTGTYPNPSIKDSAVTTAKIADSAVTTAKIADQAVTQAKLNPGVSLPPGGAAGGDLTGTYPNPTIATGAVNTTKLTDNAVTTAKLAGNAVTTAKIADQAVTQAKLDPGVSLPPGGAAGGDLTGTYPNPTIATGAVNTTKLADNAVTTAKLAGNAVTTAKIADQAVTQAKLDPGVSLPPGGAAGGDLTGTYPNPTIATGAVNTTKLADNAVTTAKLAGSAVTTAKIADQAVTQAKLDPGVSLPPSGAAGGDLTGTYPNPTIATGAVNTAKLADNAVTSAKIQDATILTSDLAFIPGDITGVAAGTGLSGGGLSGDVTLNVGAGTGISVGADTVSLTSDYASGSAYDGRFVNEGQANSVTSAMVTDGQIANADISGTAAIDPSKVSGTAWTSANDGAGSGLDADLLDGQHASAFLSTANDYGRSGVATDLYEGATTLTAKYVNEGQANSVTSPMITDGQVQSVDIEVPLSLSGSSISPIALITATNSSSGNGVNGFSSSGGGVQGYNSSSGNYGLLGTTNCGAQGSHSSSGNYGLLGSSGSGVYGSSSSGSGVWGYSSSSGQGVYGYSSSVYGVWGSSSSGYGVNGYSSSGTAVHGYREDGGNYAGYFSGNVSVTGTLSKGGGSFMIDHPLDPANKYLYHSFVESPDMMNIYNGNVITDANGEAVIELPEWFEALNRDFRYQLTVIGQFAQAIIASKIANNRFSIKTDKPNVEVSWQVTGVRHDAFAEAHRIQVEVEKTGTEWGKYIHPKEYGVSETLGIDYEEIHRMEEQMKAEQEKMKAMEEEQQKMRAKPVEK